MDSVGERKAKPVLVFDLDETLIASVNKYDEEIMAYRVTRIIINHKLLKIIHTAKEKEYLVLLLTNNENDKVTFDGVEGRFVDFAVGEITKAYNEKYKPVEHVFDKILTAEDSNARKYLKKRIDTHYKHNNGNIIRYYAKPVKSLEDVRSMLGYHVKGEDVYFFDDDSEHRLCRESNFVHITPPFNRKEDETDYSLLNSIDIHTGGKRYTRRRGSKKRKLKEL
jgi:hypothetical protein